LQIALLNLNLIIRYYHFNTEKLAASRHVPLRAQMPGAKAENEVDNR
jgi:hypothetical protein